MMCVYPSGAMLRMSIANGVKGLSREIIKKHSSA